MTPPILNPPILRRLVLPEKAGVAIVPVTPNLYPPIAIFFRFLAICQTLFPPIYPAASAIRYNVSQGHLKQLIRCACSICAVFAGPEAQGTKPVAGPAGPDSSLSPPVVVKNGELLPLYISADATCTCTCIYTIMCSTLNMYKVYIHVHCTCTCVRMTYVIRPLPVTPAQLMTPGIGRNASCTLGDFHFYI